MIVHKKAAGRRDEASQQSRAPAATDKGTSCKQMYYTTKGNTCSLLPQDGFFVPSQDTPDRYDPFVSNVPFAYVHECHWDAKGTLYNAAGKEALRRGRCNKGGENIALLLRAWPSYASRRQSGKNRSLTCATVPSLLLNNKPHEQQLTWYLR